MAEANLESARELYDFLVRTDQLKPDQNDQHRQLQERFGDTAAAVSMTTTDAPMTDTDAEPMPELDNFMRLMSGDMPAPTEQEFEQAGTEIDQSLNRLDRMSPFRESMELGQGNPLPGARQNRRGNIFTSGARDSAMRTDQPEVEVTETTESFQKADQAKKAVTEAAATTQQEMTTVGADEGEAKATDAGLTREEFKKEAKTLEATLPTDLQKTAFSTAISELEAMRAPFTDEEGEYKFMSRRQELLDLRDTLNQDISAYETKIQDIAEEKQKPVLEGMNKVLVQLVRH